MTAKALAEKAGIAQPFLSQIETGRREGTIDTLRKLAQALNLTLDDLVG
nr:helix-turn-helix transcriptional regulator [Methylobacterium nodulans]